MDSEQFDEIDDPKKKNREWVFTLNNWTPEEYEKLVTSKFRYLVVGKETGKNGTPHLQGYIVTTNSVRFTVIKTLMPRCWCAWRAKRSSPEKASNYCKKDGDFFEEGKIPRQGKRNDLSDYVQNVQDIIEETGKPPRMRHDIVAFPNIIAKYPKFAALVKSEFYTPRVLNPDEVNIIWFHGETGTGKSRPIWKEWYTDKSYEEKMYIKKCTSYFWCNYDYQDTVYMEEADPKTFIDVSTLKTWLDLYPFMADIKHANGMMIRPTRILITSNYHPIEFQWPKKCYDAIARRMKIIEVKKE